MIDREIQKFLDAIADPQCFCDGRLIDIEFRTACNATINFEPNCQVRNKCKLYRAMPRGQQVRAWRGIGTSTNGCEAYQAWEREKQHQEEDGREWVVTMAGQTRTVCGRDAQMAAITMFMTLLREGASVDKMVLLDRHYSVREL